MVRLIVELVPSGKKKFVKTDATSLEQLVVAVEKKFRLEKDRLKKAIDCMVLSL